MKWEGRSVPGTKWTIFFLKLERTLRKADSHKKGKTARCETRNGLTPPITEQLLIQDEQF